MKGRLLLLAGSWIVVVMAALAQSTVNPPPGAAPSPTPGAAASPTPPQRAEPLSVLRPEPDAQVDAAGQPLSPLRPGPTPQDQTDTQMETEVEPVEQQLAEVEAAAEIDRAGRKRWRIIPLLSVGMVYDDNIFLTNTDRVSDFLWSASAGLIYELGDFRGRTENYLGIQWIGNPVIYTENTEQNAFNQYASLAFLYRFNKLTLSLDSAYSDVTGSSREVNTITTTQTIWNALRLRYDYSDKTGFEAQIYQSSSFTEDFQSNNQYQGRLSMDYQVFPKTRMGLQGVFGVTDSTDSPLQYLQQALVQITHTAAGKVDFTLSGGVQFLEFEGSDVVKIDPVFSLGVAYRPFPSTSITVVGFRNVVPSTLAAGQDYVATGFEVGVQQQFFQKFVAGVSFGYENDSYFGTTPETPTERVDNYLFVRPRLTYAFVDWFSASIFYEFRQTTSTETSSEFYNNRAGVEILTKF